MDTLEEFEAGINAYYAGDVPEGWNDRERREASPFLMGWFMESEADNNPDVFSRDGLGNAPCEECAVDPGDEHDEDCSFA